MKDFLKDVPKLEDLPKALHRDIEHYLIRHNNGFCVLPVEDTLSEWEWVQSHQLEPIPQLTHWEASDFHKWFAENLKGNWNKKVMVKYGDGEWFEVRAVGRDYLDIWSDNQSYLSMLNVSKIKTLYGIETPCTKPIKS